MAKISKIPQSLLPEMMRLFGEGNSAAKIKDWLEKEHQVFSSVTSISRKLKDLKEERREITKTIYANEVANHAVQDLNIIAKTIELLEKEATTSMKKGKKLESRALLETMGRFIDRRSKLLGLDVEEDHDAAKDEMIEQLAKLTKKNG